MNATNMPIPRDAPLVREDRGVFASRGRTPAPCAPTQPRLDDPSPACFSVDTPTSPRMNGLTLMVRTARSAGRIGSS
jgi:hypothetical protein